MEIIPIQSLVPETSPPTNASIRAVVTLSWPYSSSTKQCALLLADPDFRLRSKKGQVRVRFTGQSAEAVAKTHVGIGDTVLLGLAGAVWAQNAKVTRTPGRSVDGELVFNGKLELSTPRTDGDINISLDEPVPTTSPERQSRSLTATPASREMNRLRSSLNGAMESIPIYSSPAFIKRLRLSEQSLPDSEYDLFADDLRAEPVEKKQRVSFDRIGLWRYSKRTPSPVDDSVSHANVQSEHNGQLSEDLMDAEHEEPSKAVIQDNSIGLTLHAEMMPPPLPRLLVPNEQAMPDAQKMSDSESNTDQGPLTPKLQPVSSSSLALPSPFPVTSETGRPSTLDAALSIREDQPPSSFRTDYRITDTSIDKAVSTNEETVFVKPTAGESDDAARPTAEVQIPSYGMDELEKPSMDHDSDYAKENDDYRRLLRQRYGIENLPSDTELATDVEDEAERQGISQHDPIEAPADGEETPDTDEEMYDRPVDMLHESDVDEVIELSGSGSPPNDSEDGDDEASDDTMPISVEEPTQPHRPNPPDQEQGFASQPQTPAKVHTEEPRLDNTLAEASPQPQATPQSEKDRIMAKTFQSLFGFSSAPRALQQALETVTPTRASKRKLGEFLSGGDHHPGSSMDRTAAGENSVAKQVVNQVMADDPATEAVAERSITNEETATPALPVPETREEATAVAEISGLVELVSERNSDAVAAVTSSSGPEDEPMDEDNTASRPVSDPPPPAESQTAGEIASLSGPANKLQDVQEQASWLQFTNNDLNIHPSSPQAQRSPEVEHIELGSSSDSEPEEEVQAQVTVPFVDETVVNPHIESASEIATSVASRKATPDETLPHDDDEGDLMDFEPTREVRVVDARVGVGSMLNQEDMATNEVATQAVIEDSQSQVHEVEISTRSSPMPANIDVTDTETRQRNPSPHLVQTEIIELGSSSPVSEPEVPETQDMADVVGLDDVTNTGALKDVPTVNIAIEITHIDEEGFLREPKFSPPTTMSQDQQLVGSVAYPTLPISPMDSQQQLPTYYPSMTEQVQPGTMPSPLLPTSQMTQQQSDLQPVIPEQSEQSQQSETQYLLDGSNERPDGMAVDIATQQQSATVAGGNETPQPDFTETSRADLADLSQVQLSEVFDSQPMPEPPAMPQTESPVMGAIDNLAMPNSELPDLSKTGPATTSQVAFPDAPDVELLQTPHIDVDLPDAPLVNSGVATQPDPQATQFHHQDVPVDIPTTDTTNEVVQKKTPARKSLKTRLSNVPDVISAWFSPKRSSIVAPEDSHIGVASPSRGPRLAHPVFNRGEASFTDTPVKLSDESSLSSEQRTNGITTAMSYFTPLALIEQKLNPSSQQAYGVNTIDVFAIVTNDTKDPQRAKTGPRDFFTTFQIRDTSITNGANYRVDVFRPWKATLPVADVGDVVLLRAFAVKSRNRQPYLLSTDASAWCVWRYADVEDSESRPASASASRARLLGVGGVREEIKGPPVELGEEERKHAAALRAHWMSDVQTSP